MLQNHDSEKKLDLKKLKQIAVTYENGEFRKGAYRLPLNDLDKRVVLDVVKPVFMSQANIHEGEFRRIKYACTKSNDRIDFPSLLHKLNEKRENSNKSLTFQWVQCEKILLDDYLQDYPFIQEIKEKKYFTQFDKFVFTPWSLIIKTKKENSYVSRRLNGDNVFQAIDNATNKSEKNYYKLLAFLISSCCFDEMSKKVKKEIKNSLIGGLVFGACLALCLTPLKHTVNTQKLPIKQVQKTHQNCR